MAIVKKSFLDNMQDQDAKLAVAVQTDAEKERLLQVKRGPIVANTVDSTVVTEVGNPSSVNKAAKSSSATNKVQKAAYKTETSVGNPADLDPVTNIIKRKPSHSGTSKLPNTGETNRRFSKGFLLTARHQGAIELATIFEGKDRSLLIREAIEVYFKKYYDSCDNDGKPHIIMSETKR